MAKFWGLKHCFQRQYKIMKINQINFTKNLHRKNLFTIFAVGFPQRFSRIFSIPCLTVGCRTFKLFSGNPSIHLYKRYTFQSGVVARSVTTFFEPHIPRFGGGTPRVVETVFKWWSRWYSNGGINKRHNTKDI